MINTRALLFLDGAHCGGVEAPSVTTYQAEGKWYVVKRGPSYLQQHEVMEYDDAGLVYLQQHEVREETTEERLTRFVREEEAK